MFRNLCVLLIVVTTGCAARPVSPLFEATSAAETRKLLAAGQNVHTYGYDKETPLHRAAKEGRADVVAVLLEAGAHLDAREKNGWAPLHEAADGGSVEVVKLLLEAGAAVNVRDISGWTPLHVAWASGNKAVVELLVDSGADTDARDNQGWKPYQVGMFARKETHIPVAANSSRIERDGGEIDDRSAFPQPPASPQAAR